MKSAGTLATAVFAGVLSMSLALPAFACINCRGINSPLASAYYTGISMNNVFAYCVDPQLQLVANHGAWIDEAVQRYTVTGTGTEVGYTAGIEGGNNVTITGLYAENLYQPNGPSGPFVADYYALNSSPESAYNLNIPQELNSQNVDVYVNGKELLTNLPQKLGGRTGAQASMAVSMTNGKNSGNYLNKWNRSGGAECNNMQYLAPGNSNYVKWPATLPPIGGTETNLWLPHGTIQYSYPSNDPTATWTFVN